MKANEDIIAAIRSISGLCHLSGASDEAIKAAEAELHLTFAADYVTYVREFGVISGEGVELTGITDFPRLSVVHATLEARSEDKEFPDGMYVLENLGIERVLILQNAHGEVFEYIPGGFLRILAPDLSSYLSMNQEDTGI